MAQTVEEILRQELGNLMLQLAIKDSQLQHAQERLQQLNQAAEQAKPKSKELANAPTKG